MEEREGGNMKNQRTESLKERGKKDMYSQRTIEFIESNAKME